MINEWTQTVQSLDIENDCLASKCRQLCASQRKEINFNWLSFVVTVSEITFLLKIPTLSKLNFTKLFRYSLWWFASILTNCWNLIFASANNGKLIFHAESENHKVIVRKWLNLQIFLHNYSLVASLIISSAAAEWEIFPWNLICSENIFVSLENELQFHN